MVETLRIVEFPLMEVASCRVEANGRRPAAAVGDFRLRRSPTVRDGFAKPRQRKREASARLGGRQEIRCDSAPRSGARRRSTWRPSRTVPSGLAD